MRGRFRRRVSRGTRPPVSWVSTFFNETAVAVNAASDTSQVLLDAVDWNASIASTRKLAHVKRIIYNGVFGVITNTTAFATDFWSAVWAIMVVDADETDTLGTTAAGSLLQSNRCCASGIVGGVAAELAGGTTIDFGMAMQINVDTRLNVRLQPDERLLMIARFQTDASATLADARLSAFSRILISEP